MSSSESLDRTGQVVALGVFVALVVDGMDLQMLSLALPSPSKELQLSTVAAGALGTYTLLGMGVGGTAAGWLSDRIGRVAVVRWAVFIFTLCTGLIAFCSTYTEIAVMRFVSGFGLAAVYSVGTLLAAEYTPTRIRTTVLGVLQAGWSIGYVVAALASSYLIPIDGWRSLFLCKNSRHPFIPIWLVNTNENGINSAGRVDKPDSCHLFPKGPIMFSRMWLGCRVQPGRIGPCICLIRPVSPGFRVKPFFRGRKDIGMCVFVLQRRIMICSKPAGGWNSCPFEPICPS